jgi:4-diphosphocytidyl-2-C-methyl-D-erythritol kinase
VLRGLNILWELGLPLKRLAEIGAGLGSDVPFFIHGGTCLAEGRGERITPLDDPGQAWFVLLRPEVKAPHRKTAALYGMLAREHYSDGAACVQAMKQLQKGEERGQQLIFNVFEKVMSAAYPGLDRYVRKFLGAGAPAVHLAGSGPVLFTMLNNERQAVDIHAGLLAQRMESHIVTSVGRQDIG